MSNIENSLIVIKTEYAATIASDMGKAAQSPVMPPNISGKNSISGTKTNSWRNTVKNIENLGLPVDWKNDEAEIFTPKRKNERVIIFMAYAPLDTSKGSFGTKISNTFF